MALNVDVDTSGLEPVERPDIRYAPPADVQQAKSPFYRGQVPTTAIVNPDSVRNFHTPGLPQYRIVPAQPLTLSGAGTNANVTTLAGIPIVPIPPAPVISQLLTAISTGYQFTFLEVNLATSVPATAEISSYKVYRSTSNNIAVASVFDTVVHDPANAGGPVVVRDSQPNGTTMFYWVSSVNVAGEESAPVSAQTGALASGSILGSDGGIQATSGRNLVFNGDMSIYSQPTGTQSFYASAIRTDIPCPNGWTRNFENGGNGEGIIYRVTTSGLGWSPSPYTMVMQELGGVGNNYQFSAVCDAFPVTGSKLYQFSASVYLNAGVPAGANWYFRVLWYQAGTTDFSRSSATFISLNDIVSASTSGGPTTPQQVLQAPANAGYCRIAFYHWGNSASSWNLLFSDVRCTALSQSNETHFQVGSNYTNRATVDSTKVNVGDTFATIRVYGVGGVGSSWDFVVGSTTYTYPSLTITGSFSTTYYIYYDPYGVIGTAGTVYKTLIASVYTALPDGLVPCGSVNTVASNNTGGSTGGGGSSGSSGSSSGGTGGGRGIA